VAVVDALLDHVRVDVRLNLDRRNQGDLMPFVEFMRQRGWFNRPFPAVFQIARISALSERCSFLPVCWAGCPKRHLDGDAEAIAEQGAYWRRNLARLVAEGTGERLERDLTMDTASQFRD
jgi:hypothetical protein